MPSDRDAEVWARVQETLRNPAFAETLADLFADQEPLNEAGLEEAIRVLERRRQGETGWKRDDDDD